MTTRNLTCRELDERLGDYLERSLDDSSVADIELHLSGCPSCAALVRDFESITRQAAALTPMAPSRDLWAGIESRIGTPVVSLEAHAASRPVATRTFWHRIRTGAIAAGLMGITAAVTYTMARREGSASVAAVTPADSAPTTAPASTAATTPLVATRPESVAAPSSPNASAPISAMPNASAPGSSVPNAGSPNGTALVTRRETRNSPTLTYNSEIASLRGILNERSEQLDPRTVAVLQSSIATIDSAIAQARSALERDPRSRFLSTQLDKALEKKLSLLRTAALLPARS